MPELTGILEIAAVRSSRSPGLHQWALDRGHTHALASNPSLGQQELERLWNTKLPVERRAALAAAYCDEAMGLRAVSHPSARVGVAWLSNTSSVITDAVLDAIAAREGKGTDKLAVAVVERDPEAGGKLVPRLDVAVAKKAAVWLWAAFPQSASDADVAQHLSTISTWETSRSLHRLLSCLFARRPGLMGHARSFSDSRVVTSMAGCRHVTGEAAQVVIDQGEVFALMALVANPCAPEWVVEAVKKRYLDRSEPIDGDLKWLLDFRSRDVNLPRVTHDTQDQVALDRIVRRTLGKERVWDAQVLLDNPALSEEVRKELIVILTTGSRLEVSTWEFGRDTVRKSVLFHAEREREREQLWEATESFNRPLIEQRLADPLQHVDLLRYSSDIVQRVWDPRDFSAVQWEMLLGLAPTWSGSAAELADVVETM